MTCKNMVGKGKQDDIHMEKKASTLVHLEEQVRADMLTHLECTSPPLISARSHWPTPLN